MFGGLLGGAIGGAVGGAINGIGGAVNTAIKPLMPSPGSPGIGGLIGGRMAPQLFQQPGAQIQPGTSPLRQPGLLYSGYQMQGGIQPINSSNVMQRNPLQNVNMPQRPAMPQVPRPQAPKQGGISKPVMEHAMKFMGIGDAQAGGQNLQFKQIQTPGNQQIDALGTGTIGDAAMGKRLAGAPKGASYAGKEVQGQASGGYIQPGEWKASENAVQAIQQFESYHQKPYWDYKQWSVGYGTKASGPDDVLSGKEEAVQRQLQEMQQYEDAVRKNIRVPLTQNQYDALVSFTYNVGPGGVQGSTVQKRLNAGDYKGAADAMLMWNKATVNGKKQVLRGLTNRRKAERKLFLQGM